MNDTILPGIIIFGILLVIALFGLAKSSRSAERRHGSSNMNSDSTIRREDTSRISNDRP